LKAIGGRQVRLEDVRRGMTGDPDPQSKKSGKPPRRRWQATEPFFDLGLSHWIQSFLAFALLTVAGLQAFIYFNQAGIMKGQLDEMRIARRPTVYFQSPQFLTLKDNFGNRRWAAQMGLGNSGENTTTDLVYKETCLPSSVPIQYPFADERFKNQSGTHYSLGPKIVITPIACEFSNDQMSEVKNGWIYVLGVASYKNSRLDTKERQTRICNIIMNIVVDVNTPDIHGVAAPCVTDNCSDEECDTPTQSMP
jgi:hypothetical protein